jgi:hypothetical protein
MATDLEILGYKGPRADIRPELFDSAIYQKGYTVLWEQGMLCSCYTKDSGQPDYGCPTCKGKGYRYFGSKTTRALITSIGGRKEFERIGMDEVGTAYLTPLSIDNVGFRDRFTLVDFSIKFSEVIRKSDDGISHLRYPATDVIAVARLSNEYRRGIDFDLSEDTRSLIWKNGSVPTDESFSVLYNTKPVYVAINPIHELRGTYVMAGGKGEERFINLPKQFQIKREDFLDDQV